MTDNMTSPDCPPPLLATELEAILTPALVICPQVVDENISATLRLLNGQASRWRPHVKTAKLVSTMRQYVARGVQQFKCATTLELITVCEAGGRDVLMAYPSVGPHVRRVREIASKYPNVKVSVIIENLNELGAWRDSKIALFIDVNPGMNRTGIEQERAADIVELARRIASQGSRFAGLHYYDGHHRQANIEARKAAAYPGYTQLLGLLQRFRDGGIAVAQVVTSGTPALPCALDFPGFKATGINHQVSMGTVIYNDLTSLAQLPAEWGYKLAAFVATTVVSHPAPGLVTCDAGSKAVSVDRGFPNCAVLGHPTIEPLHPSEEHLPIRIPAGTPIPKIGEVLFLVPSHVCTTVHNFDHALLAQDGKIIEAVPVSARGRELPLLKNRHAFSQQ